VWAPVARLGLIVVDEEHETSYKQDESPRYHARDVAVLRAAVENARVVLGSATPCLESWFNAQNGKYALAEMDRRAGMGTLPAIRLVEKLDGSIFSKELLEAIDLRLARGEQTMRFLNRRGYARSMVCDSCGYVETCPECDFAYTYHRADECLRCHICGGWRELRLRCPKCSGALSHKGIGTQRAEAALRKCFPKAGILRMDADSTSRKNSHADILGAFLFPVGPFFPGFTVTAALTGVIYGLILHKRQSFPRVICAVVLQQLLCSLLLNTFWLHLLYGLPYLPTLTARLIQCGIMTAVQLALIPLIVETIKNIEKRRSS
jgi:hypothetical protein